MLDLLDVAKSFAGRQVLQPLTMRIQPGKTTVLIGPSGCGKSTLLRLMVGLIQADQGKVLLDGLELRQDTIRVLRQRIGFVLQDGGLFPHLTARDNVGLLAGHLKWSTSKIRARTEELATLTRLPLDALDRYPAQLSGGQRQRLGIIRALMLDPALILLDEPMGALDPLVRFDLQQDLKAIFQQLKKTAVFVTHDMGESGFFGDTLVLLNEGRVVQQGTLEEFIRKPTDPFVTRFINAQRLPELCHEA
jgi:osmoprotectant transport system ATP-binding protein